MSDDAKPISDNGGPTKIRVRLLGYACDGGPTRKVLEVLAPEEFVSMLDGEAKAIATDHPMGAVVIAKLVRPIAQRGAYDVACCPSVN